MKLRDLEQNESPKKCEVRYDPHENHALIIYINQYRQPTDIEKQQGLRKWSDLKAPQKDASEFRDLLIGEYGFPNENIHVLADEQATREGILAKLHQLIGLLDQNQNLVIFFAGHGLEVAGKVGYWIPYNAVTDFEPSYLNISTLHDVFILFKIRHLCVISDSCYSASIARRGSDNYTSLKQQYGSFGQSYNRPSRWLLASGAEPVPDICETGNSPFMNRLLQYMRQGAPSVFGCLDIGAYLKQAGLDVEPVCEPMSFLQAHHLGGQMIFCRQGTFKVEPNNDNSPPNKSPQKLPAPLLPDTEQSAAAQSNFFGFRKLLSISLLLILFLIVYQVIWHSSKKEPELRKSTSNHVNPPLTRLIEPKVSSPIAPSLSHTNAPIAELLEKSNTVTYKESQVGRIQNQPQPNQPKDDFTQTWTNRPSVSPVINNVLRLAYHTEIPGEVKGVRVDLLVKKSNERWQIVSNGDSLSSADNYRIAMMTQSPSWLYLFQIDALGKLEWLYPLNEGAHSTGQNPLHIDKWLLLPSDTESYYLDETAGIEHIFAVVVRNQWPELERALLEAQRSSFTQIIQEPLRMNFRGVGVKQFVQTQPLPMKDIFVLAGRDLFTSYKGAAVFQFYFQHVTNATNANK